MNCNLHPEAKIMIFLHQNSCYPIAKCSACQRVTYQFPSLKAITRAQVRMEQIESILADYSDLTADDRHFLKRIREKIKLTPNESSRFRDLRNYIRASTDDSSGMTSAE